MSGPGISGFDISSTRTLELSEPPPVKRTPIGSTPDFSIPDDSTVETNPQRAWVGAHFLITLINLTTAASTISAAAATGGANPLLLAAAVLASILLGDLGTGVFHWSVDNYGTLKTPVFGTVCAAFQGHHLTPWTITFRSFANNVYKIAYMTVPALVLTSFLTSDPYSLTFLTLFINWWLLSQELHKYSHMKGSQIPPLLKHLQDLGLVLSRKEHGLHHNSPFEGHYCILTGVCNPLLDDIKFFRHLEKGVFRLTGNKPICWVEDPEIERIAMATTVF